MKLKSGFLKDWTLFEKTWLVVFTLINLFLFFAWDDTLPGLIVSLSGMLCVVLVAKGKISNYYFGMIQTSIYAYIAFTYGLYGEAMLNGLFYFPIQFIGLYLWTKNKKAKKGQSIKGEDIEVKRLNGKQWALLVVIIVVTTAIYAQLLDYLSGRSVWLDSVTNVLSISAQILMLKRYAEQWALWIMVNVLTITLWIITLITTGGNDFTVLVMWTAFLINSIYGYVNWVRLSKLQGETKTS